MQKGSRFIWYYWVKKVTGLLKKNDSNFIFKGKIKAYKQLGYNITHERVVSKRVGKNEWLIEDKIKGVKNMVCKQYWHFPGSIKEKIKISSVDRQGKDILPNLEEKWYSSYYGVKESSLRVTFSTKEKHFKNKNYF